MKRCFGLLVAGCCSVLATARNSASTKDPFDWDSITPSDDLEYHDCYGEYKCARLQVPLNWLNETDARVATIAMIKLPAVVPDHDPTFGGAIFTNPGGPGGSGVDFLLAMGRYLRYTADKPGRRHYEIVSFDPRGIGRTLPASDCFDNNLLARDAFLLENRGNGALTNGDGVIAYSMAIMDAFGQRCQQAGDAMAYVGTPNVARDMVEMVDQVDELRKREAAARERKSKSKGKGEGEGEGDDSDVRTELKKRSAPRRKPAELGDEPGDVPRLQYIGFSYGTVLGNYFASMFPGRVGRLILDGVCNIQDYATGPGWLTNTVDSDEIFDNFFQGCAAAGPDVCALARPSDTKGASDIRRRFDSFLSELDQKPRSVLLDSGDVVVVTSWDVLILAGRVLYNPLPLFKVLARRLDEFLAGDLTQMAVMALGLGMVPAMQDACPLDRANATQPKPSIVIEAQNAVVCADGDDVSANDLAWWRRYVRSQLDASRVFGATWSTIRMPCSGWRFRPNWSFKGPFTTPDPDPALTPGRPAAPILFLSNRLDPVTPLRAAQAMAAQHPGARVLVQEAMGHCAVASAPSKCTRRAVADYFESGVIPSNPSPCHVECGPWDTSCPATGEAVLHTDDAEVEAMSSWFNRDRDEAVWRRKSPLGLL
ncbi:TAP-like domain-containing protein [Trichoderma gracile]